jgi:hypothetical protein
MRYHRRLPPLLWALWPVGILVLLASLAVGTRAHRPPTGSQGFIARRGQALVSPLGMLSLALTFPSLFYRMRQGAQTSCPPHWPDRWPTQILVVVAAALPAVSLVIALLALLSSSLFTAVLLLNVISAWVLFVTYGASLVVAAK